MVMVSCSPAPITSLNCMLDIRRIFSVLSITRHSFTPERMPAILSVAPLSSLASRHVSEPGFRYVRGKQPEERLLRRLRRQVPGQEAPLSLICQFSVAAALAYLYHLCICGALNTLAILSSSQTLKT